MTTAEELLDALFEPGDPQRDSLKKIMTDTAYPLITRVEIPLIYFIPRTPPGSDPYYTQFTEQFTPAELEYVFGPDIYGRLLLTKRLFEDRRLRDIPHPAQYITYFVHLLPEILMKAQQEEDIQGWDNIAKGMIVAYARLDHPYYYIAGPLRRLVHASQSVEMLEKAGQLVSRAMGDVPSDFHTFAELLSRVQGRVAEPQRLEEWYMPIVDVTKRYEGRVSSRYVLGPLTTFVETHDNPDSLRGFSLS